MTRVAIAIAAILVVVLSAGFTTSPLNSSALSPMAQSRRIGFANSRSDQIILGNLVQAPSIAQGTATSEDGPPIVLLAYMGLIIVGSAVAIGRVRASNQRDG